MGDEDAPTGVAPTELAERIEAEPNTAWSLDDGDDDWEPPRRSWRPVVLAVAGSLALLGLVTGIAIGNMRGDQSTITSPAVTTTTVAAAPQKPAPTLNTDVPDANTVVPRPLDDQFLAALTDKGFSFTDPESALHDGALVCKLLRNGVGIPQISRQMADEGSLDLVSAQEFAALVVSIYPECHLP